MQKLIRCFIDTDMRCQHTGLAKIAQRKNVNVKTLKKGEHVVFINGKMNRIKMYSPGGVLSYLRLENNRRFMLETLKEIPAAFNSGKSFDVVYSSALKKVLERKLRR